MKIASFIKIALFINEHKRKEIWDLGFEGLLSTVRILHRMRKSGEVRRLACP